MQKCGKILRGRKDTVAPVVSTLRGRAPLPFRRLCIQLCRSILSRKDKEQQIFGNIQVVSGH